ncbi:MAG: hypothetical protein NTZ54_01315, partial [Alphaproteobacteria bacterium]|nr:hypothetical protein [Alphaproteobacteria bacterium]
MLTQPVRPGWKPTAKPCIGQADFIESTGLIPHRSRKMTTNWTPDSWRNFPVVQVPDYGDQAKLH